MKIEVIIVAKLKQPSEYHSMSDGELRSEKNYLELIIHIEEFFYVDNLAHTVSQYGPEIVGKLSKGYLSRVLLAKKIVRGANKYLELIELEIKWRVDS